MHLLVGLGNPGREYAYNRHNVGFMALDEIVRRYGFAPWRRRFQGQVAEGRIAGERVLALKPETYMNESGRAVGEAMRFYKLKPADLVVIYDELDLPPGKARLKSGGSTAGHRGLRSIEPQVGKDFRRLRLGIGHPGAREKVNGYVLHDFAKADRDWLEPLLEAVAEHAPLLASGEDSTFMNRVHLALADDADEPDDPPPAKAKSGGDTRGRTAGEARGIGGAFAGLKRLLGQKE